MGFLGADVDGLERLAAQCRQVAATSGQLAAMIGRYAAEPAVFGPQAERFRTRTQTTTLPLLRGVAEAFTRLGDELRTRAAAQRATSADTAAAVAPPAAPPQERTPPGTAGRNSHGRYVVYADAVRLGGTRSWRNNNPGNLEYGPFARRHGAIGTDGRFAVFPDEATGTAARRALLLGRYRDHTIAGMIPVYAPGHENDVPAYVAAVTRGSGLDASRRISSLSTTELDALLVAMRRHEGWRAGVTYTRDTAPEWARPLLGPAPR